MEHGDRIGQTEQGGHIGQSCIDFYERCAVRENRSKIRRRLTYDCPVAGIYWPNGAGAPYWPDPYRYLRQLCSKETAIEDSTKAYLPISSGRTGYIWTLGGHGALLWLFEIPVTHLPRCRNLPAHRDFSFSI